MAYSKLTGIREGIAGANAVAIAFLTRFLQPQGAVLKPGRQTIVADGFYLAQPLPSVIIRPHVKGKDRICS